MRTGSTRLKSKNDSFPSNAGTAPEKPQTLTQRSAKIKAALALATLLVASACATSPNLCPIDKVAELPANFAPDGRPIVDVLINGQTEHMVVDTGAIVTLLTPQAATALHLKNLTPTSLVMMGLGGRQEHLPSTSLNIVIGNWTILHTLVLINSVGPETPAIPEHIDGSIGTNVLKSFDVDFDLPDHKISLYLPRNCAPNTSPPPWPPPYGILRSSSSADGESYVTIELDDKPLPAIVDTGTTATIAPETLLQSSGITPSSIANKFAARAIGYGTGSLPVNLDQFSSMTIGAERATNPWLPVIDDEATFNAVLIGDDYLHNHRIFIANSTDAIYLSLSLNP